MKVLTRRLSIFFLSLLFLAPTVHAADIELRSLLFKQQPASAGNDLVVFFGVTVVNNSGSTIRGNLNTDLTYCADPQKHKLAATTGLRSIPSGGSHRYESYFVPKDEQSARFRFMIEGDAQPAAEKTVSRKSYDSLGAELNPCKEMKKRMSPQMAVPPRKLKAIKP